jgi:hypothetical protein
LFYRLTLGSFVGISLSVAACGGGAGEPPRSPAESAQAPAAAEPKTDQPSAQKQPAPPPAYPAQPTAPGAPAAAPVTPSAGMSEPQVPLLQLSADFDRTFAQLSAQLSDCAQACRSLGALERTATRLCELAREAKEQARCDDAQRRVASARGRVRASCKVCPEGPSLDGAAP